VLSEYTPSWEKITAAEAETADGCRLNSIRGYLFSLSIETYGLTESAMNELKAELTADDITLECNDYDGAVDCEFRVTLDNDNYYGTYYTVSAVFTAKTIDTTYATNNTIDINDITVAVKNTYKVSWDKETGDSFTTWDGRTIETVRGWRFKLSAETYALSADELTAVKNALMGTAPILRCAEYSGEVRCSAISPAAAVMSGNMRYYTMTIELEAAVLDTTYSGSL
jgi:hypothetical protein